MAKLIVGRNQQAAMRAAHPKPYYSRTVLMRMMLERVGDMRAGGVTPPLGNRLWLLGVDVWFMSTTDNGFMSLAVDLKVGTTEESDLLVIRDTWEPVMRSSYGPTDTMMVYGRDIHLHFDMMRFFEAEAKRLAMVATIVAAGVECLGLVAWHISEG